MRNVLVNEYTVGGSLLLVGFGFFSTRFADILNYQVAIVPSVVPVVGGASVTVGRILGIVPATLGLAVLFSKIRQTPGLREASELPVVKEIYDYVDTTVQSTADDMKDSLSDTLTAAIAPNNHPSDCRCDGCVVGGVHGGTRIVGGAETTVDKQGITNIYPLSNIAAEEETDFAAEEQILEAHEKAKTKSGTPKQQAWRSCVAQAKGDMGKAKELYKGMGY